MVRNLILRFIWVTMTYTLYTLITILDASMIGLLHHRKGHDSQWSFWFSLLLTLTFYCFNYQYQENQKYASGQNLWGTFFKTSGIILIAPVSGLKHHEIYNIPLYLFNPIMNLHYINFYLDHLSSSTLIAELSRHFLQIRSICYTKCRSYPIKKSWGFQG